MIKAILEYQLLGDGTYEVSLCSNKHECTFAEIPDDYEGGDVVRIAAAVFQNCDTLTSLTFGNNIISIGDYAFNSCSSLTTLELPSSLTTIESYAFSSCTGIKEIIFPDSLQSIGQWAFAWCYNLRRVELPSSLESIVDGAFSGCSKLIEVYNKSSLDIQPQNYDNGLVAAYALNVYTDEEGQSKISTQENGFVVYTDDQQKPLLDYVGDSTHIEISSDITDIYQYAFYRNATIVNVDILTNLLTLKDSVFDCCPNLQSVKLPTGMGSISTRAFGDCISLQEINIPESVTAIYDSAFEGCESLTSILLPNNLNYIGSLVFDRCYNLTYNTDDIDSNLMYIGSEQNSYMYLAKILSSNVSQAQINTNCKIVGSYVFENCTQLSTIAFTGNIKDIGLGACTNCSNLVNAVFGDNVFEISSYAFLNCEKLATVTFGKYLKTIQNYAFSNCTNLTGVIIPNNVQNIGYEAFYNCTNLENVVIGESVLTIDLEAFYNCNKLKSVALLPTTPPNLSYMVFSNLPKFYCLSEAISAYVNASNWMEYSYYFVGDNSKLAQAVNSTAQKNYFASKYDLSKIQNPERQIVYTTGVLESVGILQAYDLSSLPLLPTDLVSIGTLIISSNGYLGIIKNIDSLSYCYWIETLLSFNNSNSDGGNSGSSNSSLSNSNIVYFNGDLNIDIGSGGWYEDWKIDRSIVYLGLKVISLNGCLGEIIELDDTGVPYHIRTLAVLGSSSGNNTGSSSNTDLFSTSVDAEFLDSLYQ